MFSVERNGYLLEKHGFRAIKLEPCKNCAMTDLAREEYKTLRETIRARANLIAALIGMDDLDLDRQVPTDGWTVRQIIEHTLYWERHSIDDLAEHKLKSRLPTDRPRSGIDVADPLEGRLVSE